MILDFSCAPARADELTEHMRGLVRGWLAEGRWTDEAFAQAKNWTHGEHPVRARHVLEHSRMEWRAGELGALEVDYDLERSQVEATAARFTRVEKSEARLIPR